MNIIDTDRSVSSDHFAVIFAIDCAKPSLPKRRIDIRKWRSIDTEDLNRKLQELSPQISTAVDPFTAYDALMSTLMEELAPTSSIVITERPDTPWYNSDLRHLKTECRRLERKWKSSGLEIDHKEKRKELRRIGDQVKKDFITTKLCNASSTKDTYNILNQLLHKGKPQPQTQDQSDQQLADSFADFFSEKIARVRGSLQQSPPTITGSNSSLPTRTDIQTPMTSFNHVTSDQIAKVLGSMNPN